MTPDVLTESVMCQIYSRVHNAFRLESADFIFSPLRDNLMYTQRMVCSWIDFLLLV
jgi:hypothetical protein